MFYETKQMILTIVCLEGPGGPGRVGHHHPVRAGILRSPPGPDIDEGIWGFGIVTACRIVSYELTCDAA